MTQETLDSAYLSYQVDTFKIYNALVYQILSNVFTDMDTYVYIKQKKGMQDSWAVFFNVNKHFLCPDHVSRQAAEAEGKLQNSHYDGERKEWDWDKYVIIHKEQHAIMESLLDYGCSGMDNGTKVRHFLQGIKSPELDAAVNVVWVQPEKYGTDFDATMSYLGQMVTKNGLTKQSVCIAKMGSQPVKPKVVAFTGKVECKKYPKAIWNSMTREQQMQVRKFHEQLGIKPNVKQISADTRIAALEAKLGIASQTEEGDVKKKGGESPEESALGGNRWNLVMTHQALGVKYKEPGWLLVSSKGEINTSCVNVNEGVTCTSVQTVHLSAYKSLLVVETKIELDLHADTCVVGDHYLIVHDHNRPVNVYGYNSKAGLKHTCIVNATVAYTVPETGHIVTLLINQVIEMKGFNHHFPCLMQCCVNGVLIDGTHSQ